jgi:hypothetical protein
MVKILKQQYKAGMISENTLVWKSGLSNWITLNSLDEAGSFINEGPPDLPNN